MHKQEFYQLFLRNTSLGLNIHKSCLQNHIQLHIFPLNNPLFAVLEWNIPPFHSTFCNVSLDSIFRALFYAFTLRHIKNANIIIMYLISLQTPSLLFQLLHAQGQGSFLHKYPLPLRTCAQVFYL